MGYKTYICPIAKRCGGCELLAVPYELQLKRKQKGMEELFLDVCEKDGATLEDIRGMDVPLHYRHKAATPFAPGKPMRCGFFESGTHRIVFCKECLAEAKGARNILRDVATVAYELKIPAYQEDEGRGLLRHAVVRMGYATKDALLTVVANGEKLPRAKEFARRIKRRNPRLTGIVLNVNTRRTNAILGNRTIPLLGSPVMHDKLLGATFEIGPTTFYQTNPRQTEVLYRLAIEAAGDAQTLIDAYCGCGTIGICTATAARSQGRELEVIGVERVDSAIGAARKNARMNDVSDMCRFVCADATEWMRKQTRIVADALILDPPRAGSTEEFLKGVISIAPKKVIYVSCNPKTQVRDLDVLRAGGYRVERISPVDLFPHTLHVETVVSMSRKDI